MKNYNLTIKVEHLWSKENDRWIYIEYNEENDILGLNFMQGDDYDEFIKGWCYENPGLTMFYNHMKSSYAHEKMNISDIDFINKVIWSRHVAKNSFYEADAKDEMLYNYQLKEE